MTEEPTTSPHTCGGRLRAARERLDLTIEDVSGELHLSPGQIKALENDDWDQLPGATYARGYLRSYARLLNLDFESLVSSVAHENAIEPKVHGSEAPSLRVGDETLETEPERTRSGGLVLVIVVIVIAGAAFGLLNYNPGWLDQASDWWQGITQSDDALNENTAETSEVTISVVESIEDSDPAPDGAGGVLPTGSREDVVQPVVQEGQISDPIIDERHFVLEFSQRSWVDVRDALGRRLLYSNYREGLAVEVNGEPPFQVFLGNADGVTVRYLGEVVDTSEHRTRLFARFQLPLPE